MNRLRLLPGFISMLLPFLVAAATPESYIFTHYGSDIGMPAVIVNDITQTGEGRVWFATYSGLYSYDGERLNNYKAVDSDDISLQIQNRYLQTEGDIYSNLWVLSQSKTLFYYDQGKSAFNTIAHKVNSIYKISSSEFFFVTEDNLVYKSAYSKGVNPSVIEFFRLPQDAQVNGIIKADGSVWILTNKGLYRNNQLITSDQVFCYENYGEDLYFGSTQGKVIQYQSGKIRIIDTYCHDNVTFLMVLDNKVDVIIGTESAKLYCIDTGAWQLSEVKGSYYSPSGNFKSLRIAGDLYLYSKGGGFYYYDQKSNSVLPFYDAQHYRVWDSELTIQDVFADKQGNIWFSGSLGSFSKAVKKIEGFSLHKVSPDAERYFYNSVTSLYQDDDDNIYVATRDSKVHILDAAMNKIAEWNVGSFVTGIIKAPTGNVYLTTLRDGVIENTSSGALYYNPKRYRASREFYDLTSDDFSYVTAVDSNRVWFASRDDGICYLDVKSGQFITKKNRLSFPTEEVNCMRHLLFGPNGELYASGSLGLFVCKNPQGQPEDMRFERFENVAGYDINHIMITSEGRLYGSSLGGGFLAFESGETNSKVRAYTVDDGMLSDHVLSAIEDENGIIWIATTGGLNKFNPSTGSITPYIRDAINVRTHFYMGAPSKLSNGDIFFPARGGIFHFNSKNIKTSRYVPPIFIESCTISGVETEVDVEKRFNIKAGSSFHLDFYAIDQSAPNRIFYYYKMEGLDEDWQLLGTNGEIQIDKVPRGHYDLRLRSTNGDGVSVSNELVIEIYSFSVILSILNAVLVLLLISTAVVYLRLLHLKKEAKNPEDEKFKTALITYLEANLDNAELSAQDIAEAMNISRSALFDKAGNILGKAPMELLRDRRIEKAAELLKSQEYTISQIAYMCGFSDSHYFSKVFKKHYGQTPSNYRKQQFPSL